MLRFAILFQYFIFLGHMMCRINNEKKNTESNCIKKIYNIETIFGKINKNISIFI